MSNLSESRYDAYLKPIYGEFNVNWLYASISQHQEKFYEFVGFPPPSLIYTEDNLSVRSWYKLRLHLTTVIYHQQWVRQNLLTTFAAMGGILALSSSIGKALYSGPSNFIQDHQMIKKLYTMNKTDQKKSGSSEVDSIENEQKPLNSEDQPIQTRIPYVYGPSAVAKDILKYLLCCSNFCSCIKCCRISRQAERFQLAQTQLYKEIDLVHIVKQLRLHSFVLQSYFKPHHLGLVRWFDQYCIEQDKVRLQDVSYSRTQEYFPHHVAKMHATLKQKSGDQQKLIRAEEKIVKKTMMLNQFQLDGQDQRDFTRWFNDQQFMSDMLHIENYFRPQEDALDLLALKLITGKKLDSPEEIWQNAQECKAILELNKQIVIDSQREYNFLNKKEIKLALEQIDLEFSDFEKTDQEDQLLNGEISQISINGDHQIDD